MTWSLRYPGASRASLVAVGKPSGTTSHPFRRSAGMSLLSVAGVLAFAAVATGQAGGQSHSTAASVRPDAALLAAPHVAAPITAPTPTAPVPAPSPSTTAAAVRATTPTSAPVARLATTVVTAPARPAIVVASLPSAAEECSVALSYLAAHAKPGFAHYCRPGPLNVGVAHTVAFTCVPGTNFRCPDGGPEIIIANPACAISYENEASNSYWDFSKAGLISVGAVQNGRTWDPYGECP